MDAQKVDMFLMSNSKFFESFQMGVIRERLLALDDSRWAELTTVQFKDPTTSIIVSILAGSLGMLPSASLSGTAEQGGTGLYEPVHGSAPDIAGQNIANPLATILSVAMMLRYTFREEAAAQAIEDAVGNVLDQGLRTADIMSEGMGKVGTAEMGQAVVAALN